jgi:basic amino acid/polyamine antiporter, APA family
MAPGKRIGSALPGGTLSTVDAVLIVIGIVVGAGIFRTPSLVAASSGSETIFLSIWLAGGVASFIGAVCYAELASAYPDAGGDYHFLSRAFGSTPGFLFAWARMTVIQAGSIAMLAFLVGDYLSEVRSLGGYSDSFYAALVIGLLTGANLAGIRQGSGLQRLFTSTIIFGLLLVAATGLLTDAGPAAAGSENLHRENPVFGSAMIFVLLTYGGWNEAAYLSAEVRDPGRNMIRVLIYSLGAITALYLIINLALIRGLGLAAMAGSEVVAADLMRRTMGDGGAHLISLLIALTALSTMNGSIITGARTNYALGRDLPFFAFLGKWEGERGTPVNSLLLQGGISLLLVLVGTGTPSGFVMMVEYTAPVFWLFFLLTGASLFVLRWKDPRRRRPFLVPFYPLTPLIFCGICLYMFISSLLYTGKGSLLGLGVLAAGLPILLRKNSMHNHQKGEQA